MPITRGNSMDPEAYGTAIRSLFLPMQVLGTVPDRRTGEVRRGNERSLLDDTWLIATADPKLVNGAVVRVSFDANVLPGGMRLCDNALLCDGLTKRILCWTALTSGVREKRAGALSIMHLGHAYDWFVRWRFGLGLNRNGDVNLRHFDDYRRRLASGRVTDLVPLRRYLRELLGRGGSPLPPGLTRTYKGQELIDWSFLASQLGVSEDALVRDGRLRRELEALVRGRLPGVQVLASPARGARIRADRPDGPCRTNLMKAFQVWDALYWLSERGALPHDPTRWNPFLDESIGRMVRAIARPQERTPTLAPNKFVRLLKAASEWVLDYAPHILNAVETAEGKRAGAAGWRSREEVLAASSKADGTLPEGMPRLYLAWKTITDDAAELDGRMAIIDAVKHLMTACAILIAGFAARRKGEVLSLRSGCIRRAENGQLWLSTYIEKTLRAVDEIPVPNIVGVAVEVLERLTERTRAATGEAWLFAYDREPGGDAKTSCRFEVNSDLRRFAAAHGLASDASDEEEWLTFHQLRRAVAILYYYGSEWSSLDALSRLLWHFDPEMTRIYVQEVLPGALTDLRDMIRAATRIARENQTAEERQWLVDARALLGALVRRGEEFDEVRCERFVHTMLQMVEGSAKPVGTGGAKLTVDLEGMVTAARAKVRLGSRVNHPEAEREAILPILKAYAAKHYLDPVPGGVAHCGCRPGDEGDLAAAGCLQAKALHDRSSMAREPRGGDRGPAFAFTNGYVCLSCPHGAIFDEGQGLIRDELGRIERSIGGRASPPARDGAREIYAEYSALLHEARSWGAGSVA